ncbi:MAG TPA: 2-C-methyl-D-erythritol 4-phosphate cytidylyltransferase [Chloroflexota bacterium]|nr:2-C-methyl-D-erythritol 4-phosphate cytidylyltransferase [Chloroflexota bacterium]
MNTSEPSIAVVVVAAGASRRFGADKLFFPLAGIPVLGWSLRALDATPQVATIALVLSELNLARGRRLVARLGLRKVQAILPGGDRRQDSARRGLDAVVGSEWVAIHDGARPFVTPDLVGRGFAVARQVGGAVAAVPVKDTIKVVGEGKLIVRTPPRAGLWAAQTPQIFGYEALLDAYRQNGDADVTDDAELYERAGKPIAAYPGSYENLKITTPEDLALARAIARRHRHGGGEPWR